ncbi:hypothetical protein [Streptomyces sp. HD]|uniref:hypothetical protein n=1 Tax=Streptomyces sp. HD TaxID=3020892 RepID=UPI00232CBA6E|nr:hypothetical protein [Streptomyces sp. HD]MDC0765366.1 hypothetical protein [Streptomyces sp. HD]
MGTSLTPEFWERFTLLLFAAMGVTFGLAALFDWLALRRQSRRAHRLPTEPTQPALPTGVPHRPDTADHRTSVHT